MTRTILQEHVLNSGCGIPNILIPSSEQFIISWIILNFVLMSKLSNVQKFLPHSFSAQGSIHLQLLNLAICNVNFGHLVSHLTRGALPGLMALQARPSRMNPFSCYNSQNHTRQAISRKVFIS